MSEKKICLNSYLDNQLVVCKTPQNTCDIIFRGETVTSVAVRAPFQYANIAQARTIAWEKAFERPSPELVQAGVKIVSGMLPLDEQAEKLCAEYLSNGIEPMGLGFASIMKHRQPTVIFDQSDEAVGAVVDLPMRRPFDPPENSYRLVSARNHSLSSSRYMQVCAYAIINDGRCREIISTCEEICAGMTTGVSLHKGLLRVEKGQTEQEKSCEDEGVGLQMA